MDKVKDYLKGSERMEGQLEGDVVLDLDVEEQLGMPDISSDGIQSALADQVRLLLGQSANPDLGLMETEVRIRREHLTITQVPMVQVKYSHESDGGKKHYELWLHRGTGAVEAADSPISEYRSVKGMAKAVMSKLNPFTGRSKKDTGDKGEKKKGWGRLFGKKGGAEAK
jgi:hypothetical protein